MFTWQITDAAARQHTDDLRREADAARTARKARSSADESVDRGRLALAQDEVYPDEPGAGGRARRRAASGRR